MDERRREERHDLAVVAAGGVAGGASAVSWAAVLAGAVAAAAVSLLLFALTSGLDLAALTPNRSAALTALAESAAISLLLTQWISAGLGGYLTGRLRTRWVGTPTHEVFFRDTAHGFLTWCVATLFMASGLVSVGAAAAAHGVHTNFAGRAPAVTAPAFTTDSAHAPHSGGPDSGDAPAAPRGELLLRLTPADSPPATSAPSAPERAVTAARVAGKLLLPEGPSGAEGLSEARDSGTTYLAQLVPAPRSRDARQGVAWQGSDAERKDAAAISIFTALSMLVGAFIASVSAAIGGRMRDRHP
jgi:hypothetical protein